MKNKNTSMIQRIFQVWLCAFALLIVGTSAIQAFEKSYLVIYTNKDQIYVDISKEDGAFVGQKLQIERQGSQLAHPVTGKVLGNATEKIAEIEITSVKDGFSKAKVISREDGQNIHVKDSVVSLEAPKPSVLETPTSAPAKDPKQPTSRAALFEETKSLGLEESLTWNLDFVPRDMTVGDIDGDGASDIIFAEEKHVRIFGVDESGKLVQKSRIKIGWGANLFKVDAGDVDGDGVEELIVTEKSGNWVTSKVYDYEKDKLTMAFKAKNMFLRSFQTDQGQILYGQLYGQSKAFRRGIKKITQNGKKIKTKAAGFPKKITIYGFTPIGTTGYVADIDYENRLTLYNPTGARKWRGAGHVGGSNVRIESGDRKTEENVRQGIMAIDLDGDRTEEVIVVQNRYKGGGGPGFIKIGRVQAYVTGRILAFELKNDSLRERWKSRDFSGAIEAFDVGTFNNQRRGLILTVEKLNWSKKKAKVLAIPLS
ncbi:MAG: VCBS repeat-containing protein [Candidatus Lindowbacteria bacterium]|nr:VCBS repeat-containing protein [Candidatus Lindowbacteria bacterium]